MKPSPGPDLHVALLHYPVINKRGEVIAAAITNLDLHDIARAARTYRVKRFYVITPLEDQTRLARRIIAYWTDGAGAGYNPQRAEALRLAVVKPSLADALQDIRSLSGEAPAVVVTSARPHERPMIDFPFLRRLLEEKSVLLVFGTAWGLDETVLAEADHVLEPVQGQSDYNHLSVRSAVSIMLDRLMRLDIL